MENEGKISNLKVYWMNGSVVGSIVADYLRVNGWISKF